MMYNRCCQRGGVTLSTIATRVIDVVDALGGNKSEFARKINVTPAYISKLGKQPDRVPSDRTIWDICREFNVNEDWLRTGEGEMFVTLTRSEEVASFVGEILKDDDNFKLRLISILAQLDDSEWKLIEKMAVKLAKEEEAKKGAKKD